MLGAFSVSLIGCAGTDGDGDGDEGGVACVATADATDAWAQFEEEVVTRTNDARAAGATCGANGAFPPVGPVSLEERLRCAARQHSGAMGEDGFFAHDNPNTGTSPFDRIDAEGYAYSAAGENIAAGYGSPEEVVQGWLDSDGHCANLMSGAYDLLLVLEGQDLMEVARFVSEKLSTMEGVLSTATHFRLKTYKENGFAFAGDEDPERLPVAP